MANISIYSASASDVKVMLYDAKGALVYFNQHGVNAGTSVLQLPMHRFAQGSYMLNVHWNGRTETVKLVKE
ncbi:MAG TPA: T9SS type A sorting domain-containing protein [Flavisolibacter sp.]